MIRKMLFITLLTTIFIQLSAQICDNYTCVIVKAVNFLNAKNYQAALDNLESADGYSDKKATEIKELRRMIFEAIEAEKNEAKLQRIRAEKTLERVDSLRKVADRERDQTQEALKRLKIVLTDLENANANQVRLILAEVIRNQNELNFEAAISKLTIARVLRALPDSVDLVYRNLSQTLLSNAKKNIESNNYKVSLLNTKYAEELNIIPNDVIATYQLIQMSLIKQISFDILNSNYLEALEKNQLLSSIRTSKDTMASNYYEIAFCLLETGMISQALNVFDTIAQLRGNIDVLSRLKNISQLDEKSKYLELIKVRFDLDSMNTNRCIRRYFPNEMKSITEVPSANLVPKLNRLNVNSSQNLNLSLINFKLSSKELTFFEYDLFCTATSRKKPSDNGWGRGQLPVIDINWYDAIEYCNWRSQKEGLTEVYTIEKKETSNDSIPKKWNVKYNINANGYRLPNEVEWEYAAGNATKHHKYSWGDNMPSADNGGNVADASIKTRFPKWEIFSGFADGFVFTAPVGSFAPNEMGLYDMTGNVWEWCWNNTNESNPLKKTKHNISEIGILKGCAWSSSPGDCLVSTSIPNDPTIQNSSIGFRLAKN